MSSPVRILIGDAFTTLQTLPSGSVHCCVTSPPYYGLRDYGVTGQMGLEPTPDAYVAGMVKVFREVRRVLRDDGTLWLNLGDSYARNPAKGGNGSNGKHDFIPDYGNARRTLSETRGSSDGKIWRAGASEAKEKDLLGIPWLVAFALRADGWYLRSDIIWHKPNPMPESVTDRPTSAHEHVFLFSKSPTYYYDYEGMKEPGVIAAGTRGAKGSAERASQPGVNSRPPEYKTYDGTRNVRNVWVITTKPFKGAHFATMPPDLAEQCIRGGTPEGGCCATCGKPWDRLVTKDRTFESGPGRSGNAINGKYGASAQGGGKTGDVRKGPVVSSCTVGFWPSCICDWKPAVPAIVIDPFFGAGTTAVAAQRLNRHCVGIELNPTYAAIAMQRLGNV